MSGRSGDVLWYPTHAEKCCGSLKRFPLRYTDFRRTGRRPSAERTEST